jgi:nitrite reductase/ring-hydroxylating ferredoxin subunit
MKSVVCQFDELVSGSVKRFVVGTRAIAVVRIENKVYAIGDKCSHADVALSEGEVFCDTKEIECAKHFAGDSGSACLCCNSRKRRSRNRDRMRSNK